MDNNYINLIEKITPEIIKIRRQLHMYPELSLQEFETCKLICSFLHKIGIPYKIVADTGVVAEIINDENYPTFAIRAEMDALPIQEETSCEYASKNENIMHACGHDAIVSIALGLSYVLYQTKENLKCNIKFIFEPGEEIGKGAKAMIKGGALLKPKVDRILIFHLANSLPVGMEIRKNVSTCEISSLNIKIRGKASHWCEVNKGIDAIKVAGKVICAVSEINDTYKSKMPFVVGIGTIRGGVKTNVIAESVEMKGTLRTFYERDRVNICKLLSKMQEKLQKESGSLIEIKTMPKIPSVYNDDELVTIGRKVGKSIFGKQHVTTSIKPYLAGDNAGFYFKRVKGARVVFFAEIEGEKNYPLHNSKFNFDEKIIPLAIQTIYKIITTKFS
ncbi:amidohydrolase [Clostridium carboxidivorans P7]|uniref:Amidohydrolase n=1 Tax=Clostridium carboxidivorans P7 TaxID=536227 RepID=C6PSM1_9CLOT|nr:M20 family metallopeptidase [Clostridium carboxidivorans]AKN30586.1 amidohydrolase [Clostridium carboxidivorans P7]EET87795.1 amidohydrolase [Clostridium carboxidivorans P7]EFG86337.1 amidohydrolase [Clostridium carboxidivorans P7]